MPTAIKNRLMVIERLINFQQRIEEDPFISLKDLGQPWNITRERVRKILKKAGIKKSRGRTIGKRKGLCAQGHNKFLNKDAFFNSQRWKNGEMPDHLRCYTCRPVPWYSMIDPATGQLTSRFIDVVCNYCGKVGKKKAAETYRRKLEKGLGNRYKGHHFCNRTHFYRWLQKSGLFTRWLRRSSSGMVW